MSSTFCWLLQINGFQNYWKKNYHNLKLILFIRSFSLFVLNLRLNSNTFWMYKYIVRFEWRLIYFTSFVGFTKRLLLAGDLEHDWLRHDCFQWLLSTESHHIQYIALIFFLLIIQAAASSRFFYKLARKQANRGVNSNGTR